ncbi:MAG: pantetheine-phosphate adenylyltransferase [Pseudomonadales bacterium]|nr:pantetheine-phosphate adenylyltransferase [Pseudomonadales bacterium]
MNIAIYPGTFDPITRGHIDILERASSLFDKVYLAIASSKSKKPLFSLEQRMELAKQSLSHLDNIYMDELTGLTVDFAREHDANIIIRGIRTVADYEYELQLANMNRSMAPKIETIFLTPADNLSYISSSLVKEIALFGGPISDFVAPPVEEALKKHFT